MANSPKEIPKIFWKYNRQMTLEPLHTDISKVNFQSNIIVDSSVITIYYKTQVVCYRI